MAEKIGYERKATRLIEKEHEPTEEFVKQYIGTDAWERMMRFEEMLRKRYDLNREIRFPFGSTDGWGFRYAHKKSLLLYVFFEKESFCCTISINDKGAGAVETMLAELLPEVQLAWKNRYACGVDGGWFNLSVTRDDVLLDLIRLINVKVKAKN